MSTDVINRPIPAVDPDSKPFWDGCREHKLLLQTCSSCGARRYPAVGICHVCHSWDHTWEEVTEGTLYSWVTCHHGVIDSLRRILPYTVALVDLGGGIHMPTQLVGVAAEDLREGLPLKVCFQEIEGDFTLPFFEPADA